MSNILQTIFKEHYNDIIFSLKPRQSVVENVRRMINCGDPCFGGAIEQIKEKRYTEILKPYKDNILLVGINYDAKTGVHSCSIEKA